MKKFLLAMILVLALCVPAFAQITGPVENGNGSMNNVTNQQVQATGGNASIYAPDYSHTYSGVHNSGNSSSSSGASNYNYSPSSSYSGASVYAPDYSYNPQTNINDITNINRVRVNTTDVNINDPTFHNRNVIEEGAVQNDNSNTQGQDQRQGQLQGQMQGQGQGQDQSQNNDQVIAPSQTVTIKTPKPFLPTPSLPANPLPQLSFGEVKAVASVPVDARLAEWNGETILSIVDTKSTKARKIFKATVNLVRDASIKEDLTKCRIITLAFPSTKMWSTGGNISVGGSGVAGTTGIGGAGGLLPTYGRMTADTLVEIIIVRVVN